ncbi:kinase [Pseudomaricurvus alcaniphilus]|nr:kinase [Pseudomaricurvus alcaniphilus]
MFQSIYRNIINPSADEALAKAWQAGGGELPTLWLLGKTGAGKSSIVQKMTGASAAEIGNGFMPCTRDAQAYQYPAELPILRFMDTRGLGEADYDASEDLQFLGETSHALLIVIRLGDGEQSAVLSALRQIRNSARQIQREHVMVVHTGASDIDSEHDRRRALADKQAQVEQVWGAELDHCLVDFSPLDSLPVDSSPMDRTQVNSDGGLNDLGEAELKEMLSARLPELRLWLQKRQHRDLERANFERLRSQVLWYAGTAAASDAIPAVGLISVPAIQGKMLHSLARHYDIQWDKRNFSEFSAALGGSFALRYGTSLGMRQLAKLIPAYGQLAGAALAVTVSYASTYAIGRAACSYLYHQKTKTPLSDGALQALYREAMQEGKAAGREIEQDRQQLHPKDQPPLTPAAEPASTPTGKANPK